MVRDVAVMVKGNGKFDFNKLVKLPMPSRANHASKIKVDSKGEGYFSKSIIDGVRRDNEGMKVDFRHSEDYRTVAIKPEHGIWIGVLQEMPEAPEV